MFAGVNRIAPSREQRAEQRAARPGRGSMRKFAAVVALLASPYAVGAIAQGTTVQAACVAGANGAAVGDSGVGFERWYSDSCTNHNNYYSGVMRRNASSGCIVVNYTNMSSGNYTTSCTTSATYVTAVNNLYDSNSSGAITVGWYVGGVPVGVWGPYGNTGF